MENVLYDLYIAEVEIDENHHFFNNDSVTKQNLLNSVFDKHRITEQTFDTSLVWYNSHLEKYMKINTNIKDRLEALSTNLSTQIENTEKAARLARLQNLFPDTCSFFFLQSPGLLQNRYTFKTDSCQLATIHSLNVDFDVLGINDSIYPVLTFFMQCNDTLFVNRDTIRSNSHYSKEFSIPNEHTLNEFHGSFYIPDEEKALILIHDISIQEQEQEQKDAVSSKLKFR
jgi:hypothetical protein